MVLARAVSRVKRLLVIVTGLLAAFPAHAACQLGVSGSIRHVVHIQLDSVQFQRHNPNVPSDIEQMPQLLGFLRDNGTLSVNHRVTPAARTATNFLTILTGVYGDRMGVPISNNYKFFKGDGTIGTASSFAYWTATGGDGLPHMLDETGKTFPAPWVPLTRAGCDVGSFLVPNLGLENVNADLAQVFGGGTRQVASGNADLARTTADFLGVAIHCARASRICDNPNAVPDLLPDETGEYSGFKALFGDLYVQGAISPGKPVRDLDGKPVRVQEDSAPEFMSPSASRSLGYAAAMLEAGVSVVSVYIADAHEQRRSGSRAWGPGDAAYTAQLAAYDAAFAAFFRRLSRRGIDKTNTLFVVTSVNSSHFVGGPPEPVGCDGVNVPCTYAKLGEAEASVDRMLATQLRNVTTFEMESGVAPAVYIRGNPRPGDPVTRALAQDMGKLAAVSPISGKTDRLTALIADRAALKLLHMVTASPARTPTFVVFGDAGYHQVRSGRTTDCARPPACVQQNAKIAWNHGGMQQRAHASWIGFVGPGVRRLGMVSDVLSDHADIRPTTLALLSLADSYAHDGRALIEFIEDRALAPTVGQSRRTFVKLAQVYKELNAPAAQFGRNGVVFATRAIKGGDTTYADYLGKIETITSARDGVAREIGQQLAAAVFARQRLSVQSADHLSQRAAALIDEVEKLAGETMQ